MNLAPAPPLPPALPCPLRAGWQVTAQARLPRRADDGRLQGGFSAAAVEDSGVLVLLSDAPQGELQRWSGLERLGLQPLQPAGRLPLRGSSRRPLPASIDAEALVLDGARAWVASEGRRPRGREAQLFAFGRHDGLLRRAVPLPAAWREGEGRGLPSNGGPESLVLLPRQPASGQNRPLLVAGAELPLLQDPPGQVRLAGLPLPPAGGPPAWIPLTRLALPGPGWGLTDLALVPGPSRTEPAGLLALFRRFEPPLRWQARLSLFPVPTATQELQPPPLRPLTGWDLLAGGLPPDNWEAMAWVPARPGQPAQLLLASDDNFNELQASHLAVLQPRRGPTCPRPR